jgi:hypothetical protein
VAFAANGEEDTPGHARDVRKEYKIKRINITFANLEKLPIVVQEPEKMEVYKDDKELCSFGFFIFVKPSLKILLPGEEASFVEDPIGSVEPVTTDTKGGEYQLTLKIHIFDEIKELKVALKVPPLKT